MFVKTLFDETEEKGKYGNGHSLSKSFYSLFLSNQHIQVPT